MFVNDFTKVEN